MLNAAVGWPPRAERWAWEVVCGLGHAFRSSGRATQPFRSRRATPVLAISLTRSPSIFLWAEWDDFPHRSGTDDYLHEAALADRPPSGTFYDPDHSANVKRLASLGVHEHWNNPSQRQYSRNLGTGKGIELVAAGRREAAGANVRRFWVVGDLV